MIRTINLLKQHDELTIIDTPLDIELEIPHIAYIEVKKEDSKALLFTNPISKKYNKTFSMPVLMNVFGSFKRLELLAPNSDTIAQELQYFLKLSPPKGFFDTLNKIRHISTLRFAFPKVVKNALSQEVIINANDVNLFDLPILKTWEYDGGQFITMGQVYTKSLNGEVRNLGMYRLQVYNKNHLGLHWQIHKDSTHFFYEYKQANKKMPIAIGIGGDPLYTWCGQAPLPYGMYELMLYGMIKKERPKVCKCITNDLFVPYDCDIVIEGFVDTNVMKDEGPFGDHTGFYTPIEPYPVLEVSAITMKKEPIYFATVVGKPPLEDKYMGYMTERVFLPLLQTTSPYLLDYCMPENGVFHNLIIAKIDPQYPAHAEQIMHTFWGVGQMSFVKHAIFVPKNAPDLTNYNEITTFILNHLDINHLLISQGICDALDHSSPNYASGGKLGIDCTKDSLPYEYLAPLEQIDDTYLLQMVAENYDEVVNLKQYYTNTLNPIMLVSIDKKTRVLEHIEAFSARYCRIIFVLDDNGNDIENLYMCLWRIVNNIDAKRDICVKNNIALIDATAKGVLESHTRAWPNDVNCTHSVLERLVDLGVINKDEKLWQKYQIL